MALTDHEKLNLAKRAFSEKIASIETWDDFKAMINGVSKTKIKNFIMAGIQNESTRKTDEAVNLSESVGDLASEIDTL